MMQNSTQVIRSAVCDGISTDQRQKIANTISLDRRLSLFLGVFLLLVIFPFLEAQADDPWVYIQTNEGVRLYRSVWEIEGSLPFRAVATIDAPYKKIVMALVDAERKNRWAPKLKSTTVHLELSANRFEYSEYYSTPWPFKDREFLLLGSVEYLPDRVLFSAVNSRNTHLAKTNHVTANIEILEFTIFPLSDSQTKVMFTFSGDLGGWIPAFVKTIIQKKWPVRFIQALEKRIDSDENLETRRYLNLKKAGLAVPAHG